MEKSVNRWKNVNTDTHSCVNLAQIAKTLDASFITVQETQHNRKKSQKKESTKKGFSCKQKQGTRKIPQRHGVPVKFKPDIIEMNIPHVHTDIQRKETSTQNKNEHKQNHIKTKVSFEGLVS